MIYWHCAGKYDSPIELDTSLKAPDVPISVVLPICKEFVLQIVVALMPF